jgi:hypothetical protein
MIVSQILAAVCGSMVATVGWFLYSLMRDRQWLRRIRSAYRRGFMDGFDNRRS